MGGSAKEGIDKLVGRSKFKLLNGGRALESSVGSVKACLGIDADVGCGFCCEASGCGCCKVCESERAAVIIKPAKFVELLLADNIGVTLADNPITGELGNVNVLGVGELGRDFFNFWRT